MSDDEFALRRDMAAAAEAQRMLESEMVSDIFADLEAACIAIWKATPLRDVDGHRMLWLEVHNLGKLKTHLETIAANGRLAERQIEHDLLTPRKRFGIV